MDRIILKGEYVVAIGTIAYLIIVSIRMIIKKEEITVEFLQKEFYRFMLAIYFLCLFGVTLCPMKFPLYVEPAKVIVRINPFATFRYQKGYYLVLNLVGNMILLTPLPILVYLNGKKIMLNIKYTVLISLMITLSIEILQYVENSIGLVYGRRMSDTLDVILNLMSGLLGYIVVKVFISFKKRNKIS